MKIYSLHKIQTLPISLDEAWDFFSNPKNLNEITPPSMKFITLSGDERKMFPGQIIEYTVTPFMGIKMKWVTEITHVIPKDYFVDEQRFGPYALWHHKHFFKEVTGGVEIEDIVHYKLPMGILGQMVQPFIVRPKLEEIFEYRKERLIELFGKLKA